MLKSSEPSAVPERVESRSPSCWNREPQCLGLRVELLDGRAFVFPYIHLSFAELKPNDEGDELLIVFVSHRVLAEGRHLGKILVALQKQAVEWIRPIPASGHMGGEESGAWIASLEVEERQQSPDC